MKMGSVYRKLSVLERHPDGEDRLYIQNLL